MQTEQNLEIILAIATAGLATAGLSVKFFSDDHPSKTFKNIIGYSLLIGGFAIFITSVVVLLTQNSTTAVRYLAGGSWQGSVPVTENNSKKEEFYKNDCESISIQFSEPNPDYEVFPDDPQPKMSMKFTIDVFNSEDKAQHVSFVPVYGDAKLSDRWTIQPLGIEPLEKTQKPTNKNEYLIEPKQHFAFNAYVTIFTDNPYKPDFFRNFNLLSEKINFGIIVKTDNYKSCSAFQNLDIKNGFLTNYTSNYQIVTKNWYP